MGTMKFALKLAKKISFLESIVNQYAEFGCEEISVVINKEGKKYLEENPMSFNHKVDFIINDHPEYERFFSLKTGLSFLKESKFVFIHNSDNPFANNLILEKLYEIRLSADWVKPVFKGRGGHPILISSIVVRGINRELNYNIHLNDFLEDYSNELVEVNDEKILVNVNTKQDFLDL
jgi:CTP:molybdopterin cytidylyltransferase MocA